MKENKINMLNKKKRKFKVVMVSCYVSLSTMMVTINADPGFDEDGWKEVTTDWSDPIMSYALWLVPIVGLIMAIVSGVMWMAKDEEYREQHPLKKREMPIIIATIILELVPTIFKLLKLTN